MTNEKPLENETPDYKSTTSVNEALAGEMKTGRKPLTGDFGLTKFQDDIHISNIQRIKDLRKVIDRDSVNSENKNEFEVSFITSNPHKIDQFNGMVNNTDNPIIRELQKELLLKTSLIKDIDAPPELSESFVENSVEKAAYYADQTNSTILSEDSGFIIPITGFNPGVVSARFSSTDIGKRGFDFTMDGIKKAFNNEMIQKIESIANQGNVHFLNNIATIGMLAEKLIDIKQNPSYNFGYRSSQWGDDNFTNTGILCYFITSAAIAKPGIPGSGQPSEVVESCAVLSGVFEQYIIEVIFGIDDKMYMGNESVLNGFLDSMSHQFGYNPLISLDVKREEQRNDKITQHRRNAINSTLIKFLEKELIIG